MAMQTGMGLSKILILVGAGYTGTVVLKNNRLSDILGELQSLVKGMEKSKDSPDADSEISDVLAAQVRRLAMEVRQMASSRSNITVLNGGSSQMGNMASVVVPLAAVGALGGYGYMWWKGLSFSDLMYVTKANMTNAVSSMTKHLEQVSSALAAAKRHLTQKLENLDGKLDDQKEISMMIKNEVTDVREDLSQIGFDLDSLRSLVSGLDNKICSLEDKQDYANAGVYYLCNYIGGKDKKMGQFLQSLPKPAQPRGFIGMAETPTMMGLKQIADTNAARNEIDTLDIISRTLSRTSSIKG